MLKKREILINVGIAVIFLVILLVGIALKRDQQPVPLTSNVTPSPPTSTPLPWGVIEVQPLEGYRLVPIPCYDGTSSPPSFYWESTSADGTQINVFLSQSPYEPATALRDGEAVIVRWCGTEAVVGHIEIQPGQPQPKVFLHLEAEPEVLRSGPNLPTWPTPGPTTIPLPLPGCNEVCEVNEDCRGGLACDIEGFEGICRHPLDPSDQTCDPF